MTAAGQTYLYRFYDVSGVLLYIGITGNFGKRWQQHAQKQPWWNDRRRMTVDLYDTRDDALDAEALAIFAEQRGLSDNRTMAGVMEPKPPAASSV